MTGTHPDIFPPAAAEAETPEAGATTESTLLILPDGRLLARNVTPELAALLSLLQPDHAGLALRKPSASNAPLTTS